MCATIIVTRLKSHMNVNHSGSAGGPKYILDNPIDTSPENSEHNSMCMSTLTLLHVTHARVNMSPVYATLG